jgi:cytochrome o ubiquinol oxidase subunit 3
VLAGTAGGPTAKDLFELPFVLGNRAAADLVTYGLGIAMHRNRGPDVPGWRSWLLGFGFMCMEIYEFHHLIHEGYGPDRSAFLSAFFALVGTHGLHVTSGLIWLLVMFVQLKSAA